MNISNFFEVFSRLRVILLNEVYFFNKYFVSNLKLCISIFNRRFSSSSFSIIFLSVNRRVWPWKVAYANVLALLTSLNDFLKMSFKTIPMPYGGSCPASFLWPALTTGSFPILLSLTFHSCGISYTDARWETSVSVTLMSVYPTGTPSSCLTIALIC